MEADQENVETTEPTDQGHRGSRDRLRHLGEVDSDELWFIERLGPDGWRENFCGSPAHVRRSYNQWAHARKTRFRVLNELGEVVAGPSDIGGFRDEMQLATAIAALGACAGLRDSPISAARTTPRVIAAVVSALRSREGGPNLGEMYAIEDPGVRRSLFALLAAVEDSPGAIDAWIRRHA